MQIRQLSMGQIATICQRYQAGEPSTLLAQEYDACINTIIKIVRTYGQGVRPPNEYHWRQYSCNVHFFDNVETEAQSYWLGFASADASVNNGCLRFCLAEKDIAHLRRFN